MNYIQIADWVEKVIRSCTSSEQIKAAEQLLKSYKQQTNKESYIYIHRYLTHCLNEQSNDITYRR